MIEINYMDSAWIDNRGGNIRPKFEEKNSENPTTCNAAYHFLYEELYEKLTVKETQHLRTLVKKKYSTNNGKYMTNEYDNNDSFSLDESISVAAICSRYKFHEEMKRLKIFTKQTWFRIYDVIPYLMLCKYPKTKYIALAQCLLAIKYSWLIFLTIPQLLIAIGMIFTCLKKKTDTSGKQQSYIKFKGLEYQWWMRQVFRLCKKLCSFSFTFSFYYKHKEHPTSLMAQGLYK